MCDPISDCALPRDPYVMLPFLINCIRRESCKHNHFSDASFLLWSRSR